MGAAAVAVVGSIITSVVVSKAVSVIGEKIGLSENLTSILSAAAGAYAGGAAYNQAMGATTAGVGAGETAKVGMDLSTATSMPPAQPPPVSNIPGTPLAPGGSPLANVQSAGSGMLTQPPPTNLAGGGGNIPPPQANAPPGGTTANEVIKSQTVGNAGSGGEESWWSKMFTPGKTMDLVMAGAAGAGKAGMRKYEVDRPYNVEQDRGRRWDAMGTGGFNQINQTYPSQGG